MFNPRSWILLGLAALPLHAHGRLTPEQIVAGADDVRNPKIDYVVDAVVTSYDSKGNKDLAKYQVLIHGRDKTIMKTFLPKTERGTSSLTLGHDMWVFLPYASQPVRMSLQQRLVGEAANGDLVRTNFAGDYRAKLLREEDGNYVLELLARSDGVTYHRAIYWVRKKDLRPQKAEFYADSGKLLKTCTYGKYKKMAGGVRPSRLILRNPIIKNQMSIIEYDRMKETSFPEKYFTKDYLKRMKY